jgi:DUF4097 and DUF4098 domain-containing protein YvlB
MQKFDAPAPISAVLEITTARGSIRVAAAERGTAVLTTQSGDITARTL